MPMSRKNMPRYRYMFGQNGDKRPLGRESPHRSFIVDKVDGKWGPDRVAIHDKIRDDFKREFAHIPKDKKAIFLSGEPGAGKSHFVQNTQGIDGNYAVIDIDSVRDRLLTELSNRNLLNLPEHPLTSDVTPRELATLYHAEARDIVKKIQTWAVNSGRNVLIDEPMTAMSSKRTVSEIKKLGYETTGVQLRCTPEIAEQGMKARYIEGANHHPLGGRLVPIHITSDARELAPKNFERIRAAGLFDHSYDSFRDQSGSRIVNSWTGLKKDAVPAKTSELKFGVASSTRTRAKPRVGIGSRPSETFSRRKVVSGDEIPQYKKVKNAALQVNQSPKKIEQSVIPNRVPTRNERPLTSSMASKKAPTGKSVKKKITTPQPEDLRFRARTDIKREPKLPRPGSSKKKTAGAKTSIATPGIAKPVRQPGARTVRKNRKPRGKASANIPTRRTSHSGVHDTRKKVVSPKRLSEKVVSKKINSPVRKTSTQPSEVKKVQAQKETQSISSNPTLGPKHVAKLPARKPRVRNTNKSSNLPPRQSSNRPTAQNKAVAKKSLPARKSLTTGALTPQSGIRKVRKAVLPTRHRMQSKNGGTTTRKSRRGTLPARKSSSLPMKQQQSTVTSNNNASRKVKGIQKLRPANRRFQRQNPMQTKATKKSVSKTTTKRSRSIVKRRIPPTVPVVQKIRKKTVLAKPIPVNRPQRKTVALPARKAGKSTLASKVQPRKIPSLPARQIPKLPPKPIIKPIIKPPTPPTRGR